MKKYCEKCGIKTECNYNEENVTEIYEGEKVSYLKKYYICSKCNQIIYDDLFDYNISSINNEIRKNNSIITIEEINSILEKYDIGKKPLSLILGLGEITITRYIDGQNPTKENSDLLKLILENPEFYELYLLANRDKITDIAYKKTLGKTKQLELTYEHSKLYNVALYIISKLEEITPLALQKILYFTYGFSEKFLNKKIFNENPEAWVHGPIYKDVYDSFSYYKYDFINYSDILKDYDYVLTEEEKEYLDKIITFFGGYSAKVLREMTHLTDPWKATRVGLKDDEKSARIIENDVIEKYFLDICKKYNIKKIDDIEKYSSSMFQEALKKII